MIIKIFHDIFYWRRIPYVGIIPCSWISWINIEYF